ncbi:unnamed protein product, partial [Soboliphyme baturini]|uniref:DUF11 domain-containing protein n=1 Tax=Soboliphyme baturini TaxID=241478 RepID=A0A183IA60_9BILA
ECNELQGGPWRVSAAQFRNRAVDKDVNAVKSLRPNRRVVCSVRSRQRGDSGYCEAKLPFDKDTCAQTSRSVTNRLKSTEIRPHR